MEPRRVILRDVSDRGRPATRLRLLVPIRYLFIRGPEKEFYDYTLPILLGIVAWAAYVFIEPKPPIFGNDGALSLVRELLVMAVPFMIGSLAAVAMGLPGPYLDRRPAGVPLLLDERSLNLRQFVCYLLGYLCFLGLLVLGGAVIADLLHESVRAWIGDWVLVKFLVHTLGVLVLFILLSALTVTVFWSLYFLTEVVNEHGA